MLIRYQNGPDGKPVKKAVVYTANEHGIAQKRIDKNAVKIIERLNSNGFSAYIVGGAVRDLLLGREPKDYDIVTNAEPPRIKKIFFRARIIGRRFRLVHVYAGDKIFEVSTFRSIADGTIGNTYGTIDEDARRRDFTMNALYFDPIENRLIDYVGGVKDIRAGKLVAVIPLKTIFAEDPVRMIRALKYAALTGFSIPLLTRIAIKRNAPLLAHASISRLGEESIKILCSGKALHILESLNAYGLLSIMMPNIEQAFAGTKKESMRRAFSEMDAYLNASGDKKLSSLLAFIVKDIVTEAQAAEAENAQAMYKNALNAARQFLLPVSMPRVELEAAVKTHMRAPEAKRKSKKKRGRGRAPNTAPTE